MKYDLFVSYCSKDGPWVRNEFLPRIEAEKFNYIIDDQRFTPGVSSVKNMSDAVRDARFTVALLSPDYMTSGFCKLELELAITLGLSADELRFLALLLDPCDLPDAVKKDTYLDFTRPDLYPLSFKRLFAAIRGTPHEAVTAEAASVERGLEFFSYLFEKDDFRGPITQFREKFEAATERFEALERFKSLHDQLQVAEDPVKHTLLTKDLLVQQTLGWPSMKKAILDLNVKLEKVCALTRSFGLPEHEILWVADLEAARDDLREAVTGRNLSLLQDALENVVKHVGGLPTILNENIVSEADHLEIQKLVGQLADIREKLGGYRFEGEAAEKRAEFEHAIESMERLGWSLGRLVANHRYLQVIENQLRELVTKVSLGGALDLASIERRWRRVNERRRSLDAMPGTRWIHDFDESSATLSELLTRPVTPEEHRLEAVGEKIEECDAYARMGFNQTDIDLRAVCRQLVTFGRNVGHLLSKVSTTGAGPSPLASRLD